MAKVSLRTYNHEIETMIDRSLLDEAVAHCKHILKTFPKHLETYRLLGKAYLEYKRYPDAADIFSRVLVAVPSDFVAHVGMSIVRDEENKLDDAIWHMERAFETQPSNSAIQSELQRLYGRRDGVQPPRIRMTRGALAHMYVQGELYPQAISEIKGVLKEDPGRNDMQELLARAYYSGGLKNDAAEVASAVLRSNPYCLDPNKVLVDILGADHPESVQTYRQRVVELDPYASQVSGSMFLADEVPDVAVTLERLDWNGQPVGMQSDWENRQAISLDNGPRSAEQPDWLKNAYSEPAATSYDQTPGKPDSPFDAPPAQRADLVDKPSSPVDKRSTPQSGSVDDIPDFLRAAGWGQSTGAFDEGKSAHSSEEPASMDQPIEHGDLPDWVKALAPEQPAQPPAQEEELPDWINQIGASAQPDSGEASDQPDWLKQFSASEPPPGSPKDDQLDWLEAVESAPETSSPVTPAGELDWLDQLSAPAESKATETSADDFDFLNEIKEETGQMTPSAAPSTESLGKSEQEQDDSFAWLESLAAKQGATEGLLTKPEERLEEEPDWVKQARSTDAGQPSAPQPPREADELGKTEQERDDSFAWLENLAANQGATEGLLTKPEERLQEEPDWIKQAKDVTAQQPPVPEPTPEEPASISDTEAWLRSLDEEETVSTSEKTEVDETVTWLKHLDAAQEVPAQPADEAPMQADDLPAWMQDLDEESAPAAESIIPEPSQATSDSEWIRFAEEEPASAPSPKVDTGNLPSWLEGLDAEEKQEPALPSQDDLPAWLRDETGEVLAEPPKIERTRATDWQPIEAKQPEPLAQDKPFDSAQDKPFDSAQDRPFEQAPEVPEPARLVEEPKKFAPPAKPPKERPAPRISEKLTTGSEPVLGQARSELSRSNIPSALENYGRLIKKGRLLEEVIYDLREALYRYPVEVSIWQSLGDAYMRSNRLQDALDAYTKAEELLR